MLHIRSILPRTLPRCLWDLILTRTALLRHLLTRGAPCPLLDRAVRPIAPRRARDPNAIDLELDHPRKVNHGRDRVQTLLGRNGCVVRRGRVEAAVGEREEVREEAEGGREGEVAERLRDDAPDEDRQDPCGRVALETKVIGQE